MPAVGDDFGGFEAHSESQDPAGGTGWGFDDVNFDPAPPPGTNPGGAGESESGLKSLLPSTPAEWAGLFLMPFTLGKSYPMAKAISYPLSAYNLANRAGAFDRKDDTNTRGAPSNTMLAQAQPAINQKKGQSLNRSDSGDNPLPRSWDGGEPEYVPQIAGELPSEVVEQVATVPSYESYFMGYDPDYDPYQAGFGAQPGLFGRREVVAESGGDVMNLRNQANQLASQGRGGDTMLMHMRPDEVAGLASLGGVTRNPTTGLPEGFLLPALGALGGQFLGGSALAGLGAMAAPVGIGLGAGAGQALQSHFLGEDDPLKKGMVAGLTAGLGSAALGGIGSFMQGVPDKAISTAGKDLVTSMAANPYTTAGTLGGVGGMVSEAATMPGYGGPMPGEGTSGKSFRDPQTATPKTPRERTGLAQSGDLTSYGFRPEGLFFGEGVYAQSGGLPQAQALSRRPAWNPFRGHGQGVQGSVQEASGNLGEANQALQAATDQVNRAMGTLNPQQQTLGHGIRSSMGGKGGGNPRRLQEIASPLGGQQAPLDLGYTQFLNQRNAHRRDLMEQRMQEGGIAGLPEGGGDEVALQVTQDAVDAVRGEHPEPKIAIETFVSYFGPEAFDSLRRLVIQEESIRTMGKADGLVNGDDGGRDDIQRGTIDGDQELNISGGEYIFSADDVSLMGDGNTDAGARRLDQARANLRQKARGTTERPAYMGEGAAEEIFEEAMTG